MNTGIAASVIIPVLNRADLAAETLASCAAQDLDAMEVIVVDNGSSESEFRAIEAACSRTRERKAVSLIRCEKPGADAARNKGLSAARGRYIQFLDSDDLMASERLAIMAGLLDTRPDLDMLFSLEQYFKARPGDLQVFWNRPDKPDYLIRFFNEDAPWSANAPLWRRSFLERVGGWDEDLICWQDWEFHVRCLCHALRFGLMPEVLVHIRDHSGTRSTNLASARLRQRSFVHAYRRGLSAASAHSLLTPSALAHAARSLIEVTSTSGIPEAQGDACRVLASFAPAGLGAVTLQTAWCLSRLGCGRAARKLGQAGAARLARGIALAARSWKCAVPPEFDWGGAAVPCPVLPRSQ